MRAALRAAAVLASVWAIALAGAAGARAASPEPSPAIGGVLDAAPGVVTVQSRSTMPVVVRVTPEGPFALDATEFPLDPGQSRALAVVSGESAGHVSARFTSAEALAQAGDASTVTLRVAFPAPIAPEPPWAVLAALGLISAALAVTARRLRGYRLVISRREDPS